MTESQWLKAADGDALLARVEDQLSPRKWALLAYGVVRRPWDVVPDGPHRAALRFRGDRADEVVPHADFTPWVQRLADTLPAAVDAAEARQREIVAACDPDADRQAYQETAARSTNPHAPPPRHSTSGGSVTTFSA